MPVKTPDLLLAVFVVMLWALHIPLIKLGLHELPPLTLGLGRYVFTALAFLPFIRKDVVSANFWPLARVSFMLYGVSFTFMFLSLKYNDASTYIVIGQSSAAFSILAGWLILKERVALATWIGITIAFTGLVIVFGEPAIRGNMLGVMMILACSLAWVAVTFQMKALKGIHLPTFTAMTALMGIPVIGALALVFEENHLSRLAAANWTYLVPVYAYQVLVMSFALMMWQRLLSRNDVSKINSINMLTPVLGVIFSVLILKEKIYPLVWGGGAVLILGVSLIHLYPHLEPWFKTWIPPKKAQKPG